MTELGLRERKKLQTRRLIADTAFRLFAERGFDGVTVAQVARSAEVSEATVFNYFGTKETLFYGDLEAFADAGLAAVRDRAPGVSAVDAYREIVAQPRGLLSDPHPAALDRLATAARIVADSPALQARERELLELTTVRLAELIAAETGAAPGDAEPWTAANALVGVHRGVKDYLHRQVLAGRRDAGLADDVVDQGRRAFELLERGLAGYPAG